MPLDREALLNESGQTVTHVDNGRDYIVGAHVKLRKDDGTWVPAVMYFEAKSTEERPYGFVRSTDSFLDRFNPKVYGLQEGDSDKLPPVDGQSEQT